MRVQRASVEGIEVIRFIREAREIVQKLRDANWDFAKFPQVFARDPYADVVAKEIVHIFDGRSMTRIGRLYMMGTGSHFNLMGPIHPDAQFKVGPATALVDVNRQLKHKGLKAMTAFRALGTPEPVEFYNYTLFYDMADLVFWSIVHDAGVFPSGLEHMARHFAAGNLVQNSLYAPAKPSRSKKSPAFMSSVGLNLRFPTRVVEWMDKPLYGGLAKETMHVETLLTRKPSKVSHPYLEPSHEGRVELDGQKWHARRFIGTTPKEGTRGPKVSAEGAGF
jgi:hypothetical protein